MKTKTIQLGSLLVGLLAQSAVFGAIELNPIQDSDVYHGSGFPTGTTNTLGVSVDVESPPGSGTFHGQNSVLEFDLSGVSDPIVSATLYLYVEPIPEGGFASFVAGGVNVFTQATDWDVATLTWDDFSEGSDLGDISVTEESVWVTLDVTSTVQDWKDGVVANEGFLITPIGSTSTQFASMETGATAPILAINGAAAVPEPGPTGALLGLTAMLWVMVKRRKNRNEPSMKIPAPAGPVPGTS